MNKNQIISFLVIFLLFSLVFFTLINISPQRSENEDVKLKSIACENIRKNTIIGKVPAVSKTGEGILLDLEVVTMPGSGKVLTDIENLIFWVDTQQSIKTAKYVAEKVSGIDTSNINIAYTLKAEGNTSAVGGGSAGAILTLSTIAALKNKPLNQSIGITGSINKNGSIGEVSGLEEKIIAAKRNGVTLFLVPENQATQDVTKSVKECREHNSNEICRIYYEKKESIPLEEELNINIKEVSNIIEAMEYYNL